MHIPDGFLDVVTVIITYIALLIYGGYAFRRIKTSLNPERISLVSILSAGIFAAQMLNWPVPGGTSLHFVGGALAGIMLGPWLGFLTVFLVLLVQCLVFHDGGITAFGANVLNMAIIDVMVGYLIYRTLVKAFGNKDSIQIIAGFLGGLVGDHSCWSGLRLGDRLLSLISLWRRNYRSSYGRMACNFRDY